MQMKKINNTVIQCTNVKYAGAAGTIDGLILKTYHFWEGSLRLLKQGIIAGVDWGRNRLGKDKVIKEKGE